MHRLLEALREVVRGGSIVDPLVVEALVTRQARLRASPLTTLTPRELDVLREMAQGRGNAGIAGTLRLAESSVEARQRDLHQARPDRRGSMHRRVTAVLTFLRESGLSG